ncbi:hypothetical protein NUU61_005444 [Penicillium alfredii]|uniref:Uncharacterized protein n=1 Tax=Penicillium alfredii TaxID=1506179 RepID=A0A9W9K7L3_9EURO|nr:uncharacterized protein NUU61_005444 [Penicillium alfredii]KAJ5096088.1 hypothetical protein NUU61_005444 [Penicillium alfredii]
MANATNLLKGEPRLTHEAVCSIRSLSLTGITWNGTVNHYMQRDSPRSYLQASISYHADRAAAQKVIGLDSSAPINGPPDQGLDALSSAMRDDCPGCFQWLCQLLGGPGLHGCNGHSWTYLSLTIDACAVNTLRYFFSTGPAPVFPIDYICQNGSDALPPDIPLQRAVDCETLDIIDLLLTNLEAHPYRRRDSPVSPVTSDA